MCYVYVVLCFIFPEFPTQLTTTSKNQVKLPQQLQELTFGHSFSGLAQTILPDTWAGKMSLEGSGSLLETTIYIV